jgi:hypothetical protein
MKKPHIKNPLLLAATLFAVIIIVVIIFWIIDMRKTAKLDILVAPKSAEIRVNNTRYSPGVIRLEPGRYTIEIRKDGFDSYSQTVDLVPDKTEKVYVQLRPSNGDYSWYARHPEETTYMTNIGDYLYDKRIEELKQKYPLMRKLPINIEYYSDNYTDYIKYSIGYELGNNSEVIIKIIDYTGGNLDAANRQITDRGFKLSDYLIEYIDKSGQQGWGHV